MEIPSGYAHVAIPFQHTGLARTAYITFGVDVDPAINSPNDCANAVWEAFEPNVVPAVSNLVTLGPVEVRYNLGGGPIPGIGSNAETGGATIETVPSNAALLVRKVTPFAGRTNRGRFYVPWCLQESDVSPLGSISGGTLSDWQTIMNDFLTGLTTEGVPMVVLHDGVGAPTGVSSLQVTSVVGTQRKRLVR